MALEPSVQELKESMEDEIGGEDQPALDLKTINLDPSRGSTIAKSITTPTLSSWSSMNWYVGSATPETSAGKWGSKLEPSTNRIDQ